VIHGSALFHCEHSIFVILPDVHDPAQLVFHADHLLLYASAVEWWSYSLQTGEWEFLGDDLYGEDGPRWDHGDRRFWAPTIRRIGDSQFRLYHSAVFDEDAHGSRIGFGEGHGESVDLEWEPTSAPVVQSDGLDEPFAIDPAVFADDDDRTWLVFGSHAEGIWIAELDNSTGYLARRPRDISWSPDDERFFHLADYGGDRYDENNVEAGYVYNHPETEWYYLFVNWGRCCAGRRSTYNIRVGRSRSPTGPYLDRDGVALSEGGGSLFLDEDGEILGDPRFIGPGHAGLYRHRNGSYYVTHHFYDGEHRGRPSWAMWNLDWINGWPVVDADHEVEVR
jgi:arabinan endo-1,5-alpha-L-arabinosidase